MTASGFVTFAQRVLAPICLSAVAASAQADAVKDLILDNVDPKRTRGIAVNYYSELDPRQQGEFDSSYAAGDGYFIAPVSTLTRTEAGVHHESVAKIYIVEVAGNTIAVPLAAECNHSGCQGSGCSVAGCQNSIGSDGKPACTGATCNGTPCPGNPTCSKAESTLPSSLQRFAP
jgi:hypothetical protein